MTRRFTLTFLAFLAPLFAFSLHHQTTAPLWEHLVEVNVQWENQGFAAADYQIPIEFKSDIDRIQMHLLLVTHTLRSRQMEGLSAEQTANRLDMLERLERYAYRGQFPINSRHSYRVPYFIDHEGTACAVGQLLIESGHKAFAEKIQSEMNNAYVLDMPYSEIGTWADAYGFTKAELAWIQPGYAPGSVWNDLVAGGGGANQNVNFVQEHPNQNGIVIAGDFTILEGVTCEGIAYYDGQTITAMGTSAPQGTIHDIEWYDNHLYVGGSFSNSGGANIAIWDGSVWSYEQAYMGDVYALEAMGTKLYAGGNISHSGGALIENIIMKENGFWQGVGGGLDNVVWDLIDYQGTLHIAGEFQNSGITPLNYAAKWDGQAFSQVGTGIGNGLMTFAVNNDTLYAAGYLNTNPLGSSFLYQYHTTTNWDTINPDYLTASNFGPYINEINFVNDEMYVMGNFTLNPLVGTYGNSMARIYPSFQGLVPYIFSNGPAYDMAVLNNNIVIGGAFTQLNGGAKNYVATHTVLTGVDNPNPEHIEMFPNPMKDVTYIKLPNGLDLETYQLKVLDLSGREVGQGYIRDWQQFMVRRNGLPDGMYILSLEKDGERIWTEKLLVR